MIRTILKLAGAGVLALTILAASKVVRREFGEWLRPPAVASSAKFQSTLDELRRELEDEQERAHADSFWRPCPPPDPFAEPTTARHAACARLTLD
jgi:hypothetical protein